MATTQQNPKVAALRYLLGEQRRLEAIAAARPGRQLERWHADMAAFNVASFMHRNCGKAAPAPVVHDRAACYREAQNDFNAVILSVPLVRMAVAA